MEAHVGCSVSSSTDSSLQHPSHRPFQIPSLTSTVEAVATTTLGITTTHIPSESHAHAPHSPTPTPQKLLQYITPPFSSKTQSTIITLGKTKVLMMKKVRLSVDEALCIVDITMRMIGIMVVEGIAGIWRRRDAIRRGMLRLLSRRARRMSWRSLWRGGTDREVLLTGFWLVG